MSDRDLFDAVVKKTGEDSRRHCGRQDESRRQWASGRCLSADRAGVYSGAEQAGARGRRIVREPGLH